MPIPEFIYRRLEEKKSDYIGYNFTRKENDAFKAFFDLVQEFDRLDDLYYLCVAVPKSFFGLDARLYVLGFRSKELALVASTREEALLSPPPENLRASEGPPEKPCVTGDGRLVLTIRGKEALMESLPFKAHGNVLGLLELHPLENPSPTETLFFQKYANRVGSAIHNRFLSEKNVEHLKFINDLVADIEHNVIVPNMVYKLYLRNLKAIFARNRELESLLVEYVESQGDGDSRISNLLEELIDVNRGLRLEFTNIERHYRNTSLFLETLFRRSHFDEGRLTLRTKPCNLKKDVVTPQLQRYMDKFRAAKIEIDDRFSHVPEDEIISVVDVGLLAQVYANLFSNVIKYAEPTPDENGIHRKYLSYGREILKDYFGPDRDGVKYNVFSTGPAISNEEREHVFDDGYRAPNAKGKPGTGHGLSFVKNVIELHKGKVGCEATPQGNNFYFILPR